jgi:hypothetical protein
MFLAKYSISAFQEFIGEILRRGRGGREGCGENNVPQFLIVGTTRV